MSVAATFVRVGGEFANILAEVAGRRYEGRPKSKAGRPLMLLTASIVTDVRIHVARYGTASYLSTAAGGGLRSAEEWRTLHWRPAVARAGLYPLRPHDLKHSGVAFLVAAGVDPSEIARRAGHAVSRSPMTVRIHRTAQ